MTAYNFYEYLERYEMVTKSFQERDGFLKPSMQLLKIYEGIGEVQRALKTHDIENLKEELCDVILSTLTMFHIMDIEPKEIANWMELTLQKVENRVGLMSNITHEKDCCEDCGSTNCICNTWGHEK